VTYESGADKPFAYDTFISHATVCQHVMAFENSDAGLWDCENCTARAPPRFFDDHDERDDAMICPDCGGLAFKIVGYL